MIFFAAVAGASNGSAVERKPGLRHEFSHAMVFARRGGNRRADFISSDPAVGARADDFQLVDVSATDGPAGHAPPQTGASFPPAAALSLPGAAGRRFRATVHFPKQLDAGRGDRRPPARP